MSAEKENVQFSHRIFKNDPILFANYVGKEVRIITKDRNILNGIVYTIDPVSESIVLLQPGKSTKYCLKIIFGHIVKKIEVISEEEIIVPELFPPAPPKLSRAKIIKRKNIVMQLLLDNRFPVKEEGDVLLIEDTLSIEPPYYSKNCTCTNSIILNRIQDILTRANVE